MSRSLINEDSNQFGPGTDLVICLLALLIIMVMIVSFLYSKEKKTNEEAKNELKSLRQQTLTLKNELAQRETELSALKNKLGSDGPESKFKLDVARFEDATFKQIPYLELTDPLETKQQIEQIVHKYIESKEEYPYIFIIGHANEASKRGQKLTDEQRFEFNWKVAGERSGVIANLLQEQLLKSQFTKEVRDKIIIVSTGEFDLKFPEAPTSLENAFVEVIFGKEWKNLP